MKNEILEKFWKPGNVIVTKNGNAYIIINDNVALRDKGRMSKSSGWRGEWEPELIFTIPPERNYLGGGPGNLFENPRRYVELTGAKVLYDSFLVDKTKTIQELIDRYSAKISVEDGVFKLEVKLYE